MSVKSHIQLHRMILKRFKESSGRVFYLDLESNYVGLCGIKELGVKFGYYSNEAEDFLNKQIESPLSILCDKVQSFVNGEQKCLEISSESELLLKKYIITSIGRSESSQRIMKENSVTAPFFSPQDNHDMLVYISLKNVFDDDSFLKDYIFGIYINYSEIEFIVPRNCYYTITDNSNQCIVAPISPNVALGLFPSEYIARYPDFAKHRVRIIRDNVTTEYMNNHALQFEYILNGKFVVAKQKRELLRLKSYLNTYELDLKRLRNEVLK